MHRKKTRMSKSANKNKKKGGEKLLCSSPRKIKKPQFGILVSQIVSGKESINDTCGQTNVHSLCSSK